MNLIIMCSCCIDKTSTAELSEALNSMFKWYQMAKVCYGYLSDVCELAQLPQSRWFTRGWTLQELIAPKDVRFYGREWNYLGSKLDLQHEIYDITRIDANVLAGRSLDTVSVATRMSWAVNRQTARVEDLAYCLMGIFNVNMPLLYGEGCKSFIRLQEEIMRTSEDHSLFAWGLPTTVKTVDEYLRHNVTQGPVPFPRHMPTLRGLFADSPSEFVSSDRIHALQDRHTLTFPTVSGSGVRLELQLVEFKNIGVKFAVLYCAMLELKTHYIAIPLLPWGGKWLARCGELVSIDAAQVATPGSSILHRQTTTLLIKAPNSYQATTTDNIIKLELSTKLRSEHYSLARVSCAKHATYSSHDQALTLSEVKDTLHAILFFDRVDLDPLELIPDTHKSYLKSRMTVANASKSLVTPNTITVQNGTHSDEWKITCPNFAILVGGAWTNPWVEVVLLLDGEDPDADFSRLHKANKHMVHACATKTHLLSLLGQGMPTGPLGGHRFRSQRTQVMHWSFTLHRSGTGLPSGERDFHGKTGLVVDVELRRVLNNLIERSHVLFVEIKALPVEGPVRGPNTGWWQYNDYEDAIA